MSSVFNRRNFLATSLAAGVALPLLNACAPSSPAGPAAGSSGGQQLAGSQGAAKSLFPTYIPVKNGPKADFHDDNPLFSDGFENYPKNPQKACPGPETL